MTKTSSKLYKYYFEPNQGKIYPQAIELADLAHKHEIITDDSTSCHIVTFSEDQLDLMASFYNIAKNLLPPEGKFFSSGIHARLEIQRKLEEEGYIYSSQTKKPREYVSKYIEIRKLIYEKRYSEAVNKYYEYLGDQFYGELHSELIYLKRIGNIHLIGRDLLFFIPESSRSDLINSNISQYCDCIDEVFMQYHKSKIKLPLDIIKENAPTMDELIERTRNEVHSGIDIRHGKLERDLSPITADFFGHAYGNCLEGRLFDKYPDQVRHCNIMEKAEDLKYTGFWTTYPPGKHQKDILDNGFYISLIEIYRHKNWKGHRRHPDFTSFKSKHEIIKDEYSANGIRYTGRSHYIDGNLFYEIDLIRHKEKPVMMTNPLIDTINEILREAENLLREKHGLPRIGEGWISEMTLFNLVASVFPDTQHHVSPPWLKPQHLDIFVPSKSLAIEYQGKQHYEPIEFFGGEDSFQQLKKLDALKLKKCKSKGVYLILWKYDEPITPEMLNKKLLLNKTKK